MRWKVEPIKKFGSAIVADKFLWFPKLIKDE